MMMDGEGVLRPPADAARSVDLQGKPALWEFQWVNDGAPCQSAHVTGQLRWRGFEIGFSVDGMLGLDGRLAASSLASVPPEFQQLVLQHFADECLQSLRSSPLADMTLVSLQWHEEPFALEGEFEFTLKRTELLRLSRGRLTVFDEAGRRQLIDALAAVRWPVPHSLSMLNGRLQIGSVRLSPEEYAGLEVGDLVWLDDAEVAPSGLRARFLPANEAEAACFVWCKRSTLSLQKPAVQILPQGIGTDEPGFNFVAISPEVTVQRSWMQGAVPQQPIARPVMSIVWQLVSEGQGRCEGQLIVVGRRLGLRLTRVV
jgi:hypothetical protein